MNLVRSAKQFLFWRSDCILYACSLKQPISSGKSTVDFTFVEMQISDLHLFATMKKSSDMFWYKTLLKEGRVCILALKEHQLAAYGWVSSKADPVIERTYVPLAQDQVFIFDLFTKPAFRRQGIQSALLRHILELSRQKGYKRALSLVRDDNVPSLNLHHKLNFQAVCHFTTIRIMGWVRYSFHPNPFGKAGSVTRWL